MKTEQSGGVRTYVSEYVSARESQRAETNLMHHRTETLRAEKIGALSDPNLSNPPEPSSQYQMQHRSADIVSLSASCDHYLMGVFLCSGTAVTSESHFDRNENAGNIFAANG